MYGRLPVNYYVTLDNLTDLTRTGDGRKDALTSNVRYDLADLQNNLDSAMEEYRDTALESQSIVPATYELVADNPRDRTYRRNPPLTYPNPGGFLYLTNVDPAALGPGAGDYLALINKPQAALDAFRKRLAIDEQAIAADPGNLQVQTDLAYSSSRIGDLLADMGDLAWSASLLSTGGRYIYKDKNAATDPEDFAVPFELSQLLVKLARTHARLGYIEKAWAECD